MKRRDYVTLGFLLVAAFVARLLLFDQISVWADAGFWTYDARLILRGQTPFVDFLGRSPAFLYPYAGAVALTGETVRTLRWFVMGWMIATTVPVYIIGKDLLDRRVGAVAAALFVLTPFGIAFGSRSNSQTMALFFCTVALLVLVRRRDWAGHAVAGGLLGVAFATRQSAISVAAAVGIWTLWMAYATDMDWRALTARVTAFSVVWNVVVFGIYLLVVGGSVVMAAQVYWQQVAGLFITVGRGGFPLIGVDWPVVEASVATGGIPIINDVFPQLNDRGARVFASVTLVAGPVVAALLWVVRDWSERLLSPGHTQYAGGVIVALAGYAAWQAIRAGYYHRTLLIIGFIGVAVLAWTHEPVSRERLYQPEMLLVVTTAAMLAIGYLVRERLLATYYFLDLWPAVCLIAAAIIVLWARNATLDRRAAMAGCLGVLLFTSLIAPQPLSKASFGDSEHFDVPTIESQSEDLDSRIEAGDPVFAANPAFIAGSGARMPMDDPRIHWRYSTWTTQNNTQWPAQRMYDHVNPRLQDGTYEYVIFDEMTRRVLRYGVRTDNIDSGVLTNYCRVDDDGPYQEAGGELYRYNPGCSGEHLNVSAA